MESSTEPLGLMFCLDCMYKHSRDLEHHLEDAVRVTKGSEREDFENMIDTVREVRKVILQKMKQAPENGSSCSVCSGNPNPNPAEREEEIIEIAGKKYRQVIEPIKPKEEFAPESFRTICPKCPPDGRCEKCPPEIKDTTTRIIIGCPKGEWNPETERCDVGTETHLIYHELEPIKSFEKGG